MKNTNNYTMSEHNLLFALLMGSAGMMGAYTFILRGGVFCNAQTANVVLMSIAFGQGRWLDGLYFLIPIFAYVMGSFIAELLQGYLKNIGLFKWNTYLIAIEIVLLFVIGFIPLTASDHIVQVMINFIASMQFTSFKRAEGIPMSTTFCTNHIRQVGISIATAISEKQVSYLKRGLIHIIMILFFFVGGILLTLSGKALQAKAIWLALIPLVIVLALLIYGDIKDHKLIKDQQSY